MRLSQEPALKELYQSEKLLVTGIRYGHLKEKLIQLRQLDAQLGPVARDEKQAETFNLRSYWKPLAAAASVLLALTWFFVLRPDGIPQNEKLYLAYFEPFDSPGSGLTRSETNPQLTWKAKAYEAYDQGNYRDAVGLFD